MTVWSRDEIPVGGRPCRARAALPLARTPTEVAAPARRLKVFTGGALVLSGLAPLCSVAHAEEPAPPPPPTWTVDIGAAYERLPAWPGSSAQRSITEPYFSVNWRDQIELSVLDGLTVDLIHGAHWHGGAYANYLRGRNRSDLGALRSTVSTVHSSFVGGPYLSYEFNEKLESGVRLAHDLTRPGAQGEFYLSWDLPPLGHFNQSLEATGRFADQTMQQRYFGVEANTASPRALSGYRASGGWQGYSLDYTGVMPLSEHLAVSANFELGRLTGSAADSPLVRLGGSRDQRSLGIALIYRFAP